MARRERVDACPYTRASSFDDADALLAQPGAVPRGGGTDLVVAIRNELARPTTVVDLTRVQSARELTWQPYGGLQIGTAVPVARLAPDGQVRDRFRALADAGPHLRVLRAAGRGGSITRRCCGRGST